MKESFIRWAGSKRRFLSYLKPLFPNLKGTAKYIEPFVGSGIVFFNVNVENCIIADTNPDIANCFDLLTCPIKFNNLLVELKDPKYKCDRETFLNLRDRFNAIRNNGSQIEQVALFLFMQHCSFHSLYQINKQGKFTSAFGKPRKMPFYDRIKPLLENAHQFVMSRKSLIVLHESFDTTLSRAQKGDFIYLDPPYLASKLNYSSNGFTFDDHTKLIEWCDRLDKMGCYVLYSNANVPAIVNAFTLLGSHWTISKYTRQSSFAGGEEILITNRIRYP